MPGTRGPAPDPFPAVQREGALGHWDLRWRPWLLSKDWGSTELGWGGGGEGELRLLCLTRRKAPSGEVYGVPWRDPEICLIFAWFEKRQPSLQWCLTGLAHSGKCFDLFSKDSGLMNPLFLSDYESNAFRYFTIVCAQLLSCTVLSATPWTVAHQAPLSMGFPRQEYWSGLPFHSPEDLPNPGSNPCLRHWQANSLPSELPGKLHFIIRLHKIDKQQRFTV